MRAVVAVEQGVLAVRELPEPEPGPGDMTIDVAYAGLNFADVLDRRARRDPFVPGLEVSGHVRAVGAGVELEAGRPVSAYVRTGGYAEVALARAAHVLPVGGAGPAHAACVPCVGVTAWTILRDAARLQAGETVLIHAAAGGLGTLLGQLARHLGAARVIGTVGDAAKAAYATGFGFDEIVERGSFTASGLDVAVDSVGGAARRQTLEALAPFGRLVICGNAAGADEYRPSAARLMRAGVSITGYSIDTLVRARPERFRSAGREVLDLLERGAARIDITEVIALDDVADAHRRLEAGRTRGKLVLQVARSS